MQFEGAWLCHSSALSLGYMFSLSLREETSRYDLMVDTVLCVQLYTYSTLCTVLPAVLVRFSGYISVRNSICASGH